MKKTLTFIAIITILWGITALFIQGKESNDKNPIKSLTQILTQGKWVNKSNGYRTSYKTKDVVERYKTFNFEKNNVFTMDSAKQIYSGTWKISGDSVYLIFQPKTVTHFKQISVTEIIELKQRSGIISGNFLKVSDNFLYENKSDSIVGLLNFYQFSAFPNTSWKHIIMILAALIFLFIAIKFNYEPLLLVPIGIGIIIGNIPMFQVLDFNLGLGVYEQGSFMNFLYSGVFLGIFPPLIFLGIGAMTDFSTLISSPKLMMLGIAAQIGIFATFFGALYLGFAPQEAAAIGIIGSADGPTAIFTASKLANGIHILSNGMPVKNLIAPISIAAYTFMALVPVIQPPVMRLLTSKKERLIRMKPPRTVSKFEKIIFPIVGLLITAFISPASLPILGMLFFGNLLKESGVTKRLAEISKTTLIDTITILLGVAVGASTQADVFLTKDTLYIIVLGLGAFVLATSGGVIFAKIMNLFSTKGNQVNPLIGAAGVSALPDSARVSQMEGLREDPTNHLLIHAMGPNIAGVIGSAIAAGILINFMM